MTKQRARVYDVLTSLVVIIVVALDQWTKALVVANLGPSETGPQINIVGNYLVLFYIRNNGAAFSLFSNSIALVVLIAVALVVLVFLYVRMRSNGSLGFNLIFGLIMGGAASNLIDRVRHSGYVVDFISFRIPQINFYFAIFNLADAAISVGVFLLFVALIFGSFRRPRATPETPDGSASPGNSAATSNNPGDSLENQQRSTPLT